MLGLGLKERVGYAQAVVSAYLEQFLAIVVRLADAELSKTRGPRVLISAHSGVEVAQGAVPNFRPSISSVIPDSL